MENKLLNQDTTICLEDVPVVDHELHYCHRPEDCESMMVEDEDVAAEEPSKDCELITVAVSESSVSYWKSLFITTVVDKGLWPSGTT